MTDYQLWGFTYLNYGKDDINVITGTKEESEYEEEIMCYDGISIFSFKGHFYIGHYPKIKDLTDSQKNIVRRYCGYEPEDGEFGVVMGALGEIEEVSESLYIHHLFQLES